MNDVIVNAKRHTLEVKSSFVNPSNVNPHFEHPEAYGLHDPQPHPEAR